MSQGALWSRDERLVFRLTAAAVMFPSLFLTFQLPDVTFHEVHAKQQLYLTFNSFMIMLLMITEDSDRLNYLPQ